MPVITSDCGADDLANNLFASLTATGPQVLTVDLLDPALLYEADNDAALYTDLPVIDLDTLTESSLDGEGVFDRLMATVDLHIQREFKDNRITGDQYAKVYTEVMGGVLSTATQFTLSKDKSHWDAVTAQLQARVMEVQTKTALVEMERTRVETAKLLFEMHQAGAGYALSKMQLATADAQHCNTIAQTTSLGLDIDTKTYALANTLPMQLNLISEQREAERAKTLDTRTDGAVVVGSVGKQKDLYTQQIDSFIKDSKYKTAKMYLDGWITQKTLDEGLLAPTQLTNTNVDAVLASLRGTNGLT